MADLSIVWPTRKAPVNGKATFSAVHEAQAYETRPVDTEDFGSVLLRFDDGSKGSFYGLSGERRAEKPSGGGD